MKVEQVSYKNISDKSPMPAPVLWGMEV